MLQVNFCPLFWYSGVSIGKRILVISRTQGQTYTWAPTCSSVGSQSISIPLPGGRNLTAASLYCFRLLLKVMSLSFVYQVTVFMSTGCLWDFKELFKKRSRSLENHSISHGKPHLLCLDWSCFRDCWRKCFWVNGCLSLEPLQSARVFLLHCWYQRNYNSCRKSISRYDSDLHTVCFSTQLSKCVTNLSRNFIKYSEYYILL